MASVHLRKARLVLEKILGFLKTSKISKIRLRTCRSSFDLRLKTRHLSSEESTKSGSFKIRELVLNEY